MRGQVFGASGTLMADRRKVPPSHHEHDDQTRAAALQRGPDIFTPCRVPAWSGRVENGLCVLCCIVCMEDK